MIKGALVVNGYMRTAKFEDIKNLYIEAGQRQNIEIEVWYTDEVCYGIKDHHEPFINKAIEDKQFILFLDKDVMLARHLEDMGLKVFNASQAIANCDHKGMTMMALMGSGIATAKTLMAPLVFKGMFDESKEDTYIEKIEEALDYPLVVKECYGSFGMQVYLVHNKEELIKIRRQLIDIPHLYQEFIKSSKGRDVRIYVVGGKVVTSMLRRNEEDFRANITNGGNMHEYEPSEAFKEVARRACKYLGLDFAGVDLMFGKEDEPILCEVNSNAHIRNVLELTGINVADKIMEYIKDVTEDERSTRL